MSQLRLEQELTELIRQHGLRNVVRAMAPVINRRAASGEIAQVSVPFYNRVAQACEQLGKD